MSGGGVSLLILALVASICLAVVPQNLTNEYGNNAVTTAADDDSIWTVVNLGNDDAENRQKISAAPRNYVKFVLQADWNMGTAGGVHFSWRTKTIIDLNGHKVTSERGIFYFYSPVEITDSSAADNGGIYCSIGGNWAITLYETCKTFIFSGGSVKSGRVYCVDNSTPIDIYLFGGEIPEKILTYGNSAGYHEITFPSDATLAISKSDSYCGAYNYAYGVAWDLVAGDCILEHIKENVPHYLWYRESDKEWYHLLMAL